MKVNNAVSLGSLAAALVITLAAGPAASADLIAFEGFESGDFSGGTGWTAASWTVSAGTHVVTSQKHSGSNGADMASGNRSIERTVDLTGYSDVKLSFWWGQNFLEGDENLVAKFFDGDTTVTLETIAVTANSPSGSFKGWYFREYNLDTSTLTGTSQKIRFETIEGGTDFFYLDDITINGVIPEPASLALLGLGGLMLLPRRRGGNAKTK